MLQATRPFIDPVTFRKVSLAAGSQRGAPPSVALSRVLAQIVFVDKHNAALMAEKFDMSCMERCLGGESNWTFSFDAYAQQMRRAPPRLPASQPVLCDGWGMHVIVCLDPSTCALPDLQRMTAAGEPRVVRRKEDAARLHYAHPVQEVAARA